MYEELLKELELCKGSTVAIKEAIAVDGESGNVS